MLIKYVCTHRTGVVEYPSPTHIYPSPTHIYPQRELLLNAKIDSEDPIHQNTSPMRLRIRKDKTVYKC